MAPKLTKRELERERAEQQQQQGGMAQQQAQGMDPYAMAHMGGGAHPHDMVMGGDALGGQPMGAASMLPGGVGSPPPHHPMGMYQYPDHSGEDLGSYVVSEESPVSLCLGHCSPTDSDATVLRCPLSLVAARPGPRLL